MTTASPGEFVLHCRTEDGVQVQLYYDPYRSVLQNEDGVDLLSSCNPVHFEAASLIHPESPGRKSSSVSVLKIQLGMQCNYACTYCNQAGEVTSAAVSKTADADEFLEQLQHWMTGSPEKIEFWGGEPFLYLAKIKKLLPTLRARYPNVQFSIVTNGSLIDEEIIALIEQYDIFVAVSHDGPGHHLRGPDPFSDPQKSLMLRELWRRRKLRGRASFNVVITPASNDLMSVYQWFSMRLDDPDVALNAEGIVTVYDDVTLHGAGHWRAIDYQVLHQSMVDCFQNGRVFSFSSIANKARDFLKSLQEQRPASALGQKCGMDRADQIAVDLRGNVMTCQNTGAKGNHLIGTTNQIDAVRLDTSTHWSHRECCNHCPVLQLCKGSCMYLDGEKFSQSCENEFHYNKAILAGILKRVCNLELVSISGDIRRPKLRKILPIFAA
jgi:uncharacterized protein